MGCRIRVWVRVGVPFWKGEIRVGYVGIGIVVVVVVGCIIAIVAVGSRVAVITGCRSLWSSKVVAIGKVRSRSRITRLLAVSRVSEK